jgi:hypothetical protein
MPNFFVCYSFAEKNMTATAATTTTFDQLDDDLLHEVADFTDFDSESEEDWETTLRHLSDSKPIGSFSEFDSTSY